MGNVKTDRADFSTVAQPSDFSGRFSDTSRGLQGPSAYLQMLFAVLWFILVTGMSFDWFSKVKSHMASYTGRSDLPREPPPQPSSAWTM